MEHELIFTPGLANAAFLVGAGGEAFVDSPRDPWRVLAAAVGWRVTHALDTHVQQRLPVRRARAARSEPGEPRSAGVVGDFREPDIVRLALVPFLCTSPRHMARRPRAPRHRDRRGLACDEAGARTEEPRIVILDDIPRRP
jgi:hypothetical protein